MRPRRRIPQLLAGLVIVLGLGGMLALADGPDRPEPESERPVAPFEVASPERIAGRLEALRELEFERVPDVKKLTAEEWRKRTREAAEKGPGNEGDRGEVEAVESFLKLSGLATSDFEAEQATEGIGELIGGFYRPKKNQLVLVEMPIQGARGEERVIAHEFEHALQDQHYPKALKLGALDGEAEIALTALVEGEASLIERRYARRYLGIDTADADKSLLSPTNLAVGLPPALVASVRFPYTAGTDFVAALRRRGGWELVDEAFEKPPTTSEQILHPGKFLAHEEGVDVSTPPASVLGPGWESIAEVESGELDATVILAAGVGADVAKRAAKGWEGGAFASYRLAGTGSCDGICRQEQAAVVAYEWETPADATEFAVAASRYLAVRLSEGRRQGTVFPIGDAAAALAVHGTTANIAYAPAPSLAQELADAP
jgi:hypothetical protein